MINNMRVPGNTERLRVALKPPHADDESIGPLGTALKLGDAGAEMVASVQSLGRPEQHVRRRAEFAEACGRAAFTPKFPDVSARISRGDDLVAAQEQMTESISEFLYDYRPDIIISPSVHDNHPGHEVVARAIRDSIVKTGIDTQWWMHSTWGHLIDISLYSPIDEATFKRVIHVVDAYEGENARNNYQDMVEGSARANAPLGTERLNGPGAERVSPDPKAELFTQAIRKAGLWLAGAPRTLDMNQPLGEPRDNRGAHEWLAKELLYAKSPYEIHREYLARG